MSEAPRRTSPGTPDLDLLEYVVVSAPAVDGLTAVVEAVVDLVRSGPIRLIDIVILVRQPGQVQVQVMEADDPAGPVALSDLVLHDDHDVLLSRHDIDLVAATLDPDTAAVLLLVEDRWAQVISVAARAVGGRLTAGERIARDRARVARDSPGGGRSTSRARRTDLLGRSPLGEPTDEVPAIDRTAQVRQLASLVQRGVLSVEQYDLQRRRVLDD